MRDCLPRRDDEQELPPLPAQAQRDSGAARKRQKRSHEDPPGSLSERDLELDAIQGRLGRRLSNQGKLAEATKL